MNKRGFTLIELLVVISIISLLASTILTSLSAARTKGKNGKIQSETISLRNQVEVSWDGIGYRDLTSTIPGPSGYAVALLDPTEAPTYSVSTQTLAIVNSLLSDTSQLYGGGINTIVCPTYVVGAGYPFGASPATNGITVFTNSSTPLPCGPFNTHATKYAIYSSYLPKIGLSGYFCVDSTGQTSETHTGGIPANPGPGPTCN